MHDYAKLFLVACAALFVIACGGSTKSEPEPESDPVTGIHPRGGCYTAKSDSIKCDACEEMTGPTWGNVLDTLRASCAADPLKHWVTDTCSSGNLVNRCVVNEGTSAETILYTYAGCDAAGAEQICASMGGVTRNL